MSGMVATACWFGKVPTRGDFIKGNASHPLIGLLDRWVSQTMEALSEDPCWKTLYDAASPVDFLFLGAQSRVSVVGHLRPSHDSAGRRYPFLTAATIERDDSLMFRCAPAALPLAFSRLAGIAARVIGDEELNVLSHELDSLNCAAEFESALQGDPLGKFVRATTLVAMAEMLALPGADAVRRIILGIGILMRPLLGQGKVKIDKEVVLPLPGGERQRYLVAGLWLYLVSAFLRRTSVELQVLLAQGGATPSLILGFNGEEPAPLLGALSPSHREARVIPLLDPEWVGDLSELSSDYGIAKLSAYLEQPNLTLELAIQMFREVFLGE